MANFKLPAVIKKTTSILDLLTVSLGIPRTILASNEDIDEAWKRLPKIISNVPVELRDEGLAKMCVAVASGLFDGAINYIWNSAIVELREKVKRFGLNVVRQVTEKRDFDEQTLIELKDIELLELCLKLNLITEEGFFFLDQCRDIRNNFSSAHPPVGQIDDSELITFVNRCAKFALNDEINPIGVDIQSFIRAINDRAFSVEQKSQWCERLSRTHEAQRDLLFGMLHGIYCDPSSSEFARLNSLTLLKEFVSHYSPNFKSNIIDRHQEYLAKGDDVRHANSQELFKKLGILSLLSKSEVHSMISNACDRLYRVHQSFDNFYNEPPFAERLLELSNQSGIPETSRQKYVIVVATCAVGNPHGVSNIAFPYYEQMIKAFNSKEIDILLKLPKSKTVIGNRIRNERACRYRYKQIIKLISEESVSAESRKEYEKWK